MFRVFKAEEKRQSITFNLPLGQKTRALFPLFLAVGRSTTLVAHFDISARLRVSSIGGILPYVSDVPAGVHVVRCAAAVGPHFEGCFVYKGELDEFNGLVYKR